MRPDSVLSRVIAGIKAYPGGVESGTLAFAIGANMDATSGRLNESEKLGAAWPVRSYSANNRALWFPTEADRATWLGLHMPVRRRATAKRGRGVPPGVTIGAVKRSDADATNPNSVVVQVIPSPTYDSRFQCAPGQTVYGCGFSVVGIGRDVDTGRGWGQEAAP